MPTLRLAAIFVASGLVVTGCYASSVLDEASSGSRLRARHWVPASGERSFAGWFDTELDHDCHFVWLEGGGHRCLPIFAARPGPTYYADAACTEPVVEVAPDSPCRIERDFMYELVQRREECTGGAQYRFYELEGPMSASRAFVRRDGECMETTPPDQVRRARRLPPEHFVGAETVAADEPGHGRLGRERLVADDGSVQLGGLFDRERGESCRPGSATAFARTATPCLPFSAANLVFCSTEWAPHGEACGRPDVAYVQSPGTCTSVGDILVFSVAEEPETFAEECRGTTEGYLITGDATDELAWMTPAPDGEGRLQPIVWTDAEGTALTGGGGTYLDDELGFRCQPVEMADGVTRCVPQIAESIFMSAGTFQPGRGLYADAACTDPAVELTMGCDAEIEWVHETVPIAECPVGYEITSIRPVGERVEAAYQIDRETGDCVPYEVGASRVPHRLGPALDVERLAVVELVVD